MSLPTSWVVFKRIDARPRVPHTAYVLLLLFGSSLTFTENPVSRTFAILTTMSLRETRSSNEKYSTAVHEPPWLIRLPMRLVQGAVASGYSLFRPYAPQMVPLMAFAITIPILVFFSLSAGWLVWRSIAVSWETDLYLQYGCVPNRVHFMPMC